jgi:hypothetical protein
MDLSAKAVGLAINTANTLFTAFKEIPNKLTE